MLKKISEMHVVTKLLVSFALVIIMFFSVAIYSNLVIRDMDYLYRYRIDHMEARNILLLELHQELTEFRRLLKASYYNPVWIETSSAATRRTYEEFITRSYHRMGQLAQAYKTSVDGDTLFYAHLEEYTGDDLIYKMQSIITFIDDVFYIFNENFFIGGSDSHYKGNVLDYTHAVEYTINHLRAIERRVDMSIQAEIEDTVSLSMIITVVTIIITFTFSLALAWITIKSLSKWVKNIEETAIKSLQESSEAEANSQAKSRFLARMSHEIRTPISAVIGVSEIQLQKKDLPKDVEDAFQRVYTSSSTLIGILNDILDLSKIEAGKMDIIMAEYNVAGLIQDVLQMHVVSLDNKKFKFKVNVDPTLPSALIGDILRMKQVLNNVMSNAFKYTELGVVEFSIKGVAHPTAGMINLVVSIRDTGRGMTKEQVETLLNEEYTRFHEKETPEVYGTGLGMPIVLSLVDLMGAHIDVESHVKAGTKVTLLIPQQRASIDEIGIKTAESLSKLETVTTKLPFTPESMPHGRVLVVDDVETNLFVAKGLLGLYDLQIETCTNASDAISRIKCGETYDIIFMDHMMPELNGMDATKIIRDVGYEKPIVAVTANALVGQAEEFLSNGFDDFIGKPIQTRYLHEVLMRFVGKADGTKYIPPKKLTTPPPPEDDSYYNSPEVIKMVSEEFLSTQRGSVAEIKEMLEIRDYENARRLAHTVKGMAHMMKETKVSSAAQAIEATIYKGGIPTDEQIAELEKQMERVFDKHD